MDHALIGGEVQMGFNNVQTLLQSVQAGQLVALAVAAPAASAPRIAELMLSCSPASVAAGGWPTSAS